MNVRQEVQVNLLLSLKNRAENALQNSGFFALGGFEVPGRVLQLIRALVPPMAPSENS